MSAVMSEVEPDNVTEFRTPGPGERLRTARLSLGMDLSKIANEIHLTGDTVDAIERDDYSEMPARVFVRGYVRNYARTVSLPVDSILHQFDEIWPDDESTVKMHQPPRLAADSGHGKTWAGMVTWVLLLGGAALFLIWWQGYLDGFTASTDADETVAVAPSAANTLPVAQPPLASPAPAPVPMATADAPAQLTLPKPAAPAQVPAPAVNNVKPGEAVVTEAPTATLPAQAEEILASSEIDQAEPSVSNAESSVPAESVAAVPAAQEAVVKTVDAQGVYVSFSSACWVDIRDSSRRFKLFGEMAAGSKHKLGGKGPYKVVIGNARAATITVAGQTFDLAPHTKGNVARFTFNP